MIPRIVSVDSRVFSARRRTSDATTAKRRPCSPAATDSIAAFSARRWILAGDLLMMSITLPISCDFSSRKRVFPAMSPTRSLIRIIASTPSSPSIFPRCATSTDRAAASFTDSAFRAICMDVRESSSTVAVTSATDVACCEALAAWSWIIVVMFEEKVLTLVPASWIWRRTVRRFSAMELKACASDRTSSNPSSGICCRSSPAATRFVLATSPYSPEVVFRRMDRTTTEAPARIASPAAAMLSASPRSSAFTSL